MTAAPGGRRNEPPTQKTSPTRLVPRLDLEVRQVFSFCADGRTLRIASFLRSPAERVVVDRVGLLELEVAGQDFRLMGPEFVSSPVFGESIFAGIEHPSAFCKAQGKALWLAQHTSLVVARDWTRLPSAVFGSCASADREAAGAEALRRAFLRYLETVRVQPKDMHVHYNDWWTAPVPSSQQFVLGNLADLRKGLRHGVGPWQMAVMQGGAHFDNVNDVACVRFSGVKSGP